MAARKSISRRPKSIRVGVIGVGRGQSFAAVRAGRAFDNGVAVGSYYMDAHEPINDKRTSCFADREAARVPPYHIPLRCLVARDARNLWMAGRNLSADFFALSSARVSPTCAMMGQAAGVAAAMAAQQGSGARGVPAGEVRRVLLHRGANLNLTGRPSSPEGNP